MQETSRIESCASCPVGNAAGVRFGGRCPMVDRRHEPRECLYVEGEPVHLVWFVKRGSVILSRAGDSDGESPRAVRTAGAFVGLEALVQSNYRDTARIASRATLCGAPRTVVDKWLGSAGMPARMMLEQVLTSECRDRVRAASPDGTADQRVARWILDCDGDAEHLPREQLAGLLGMVPETLSRALARLAHAGAIDVTRRDIAIKDRTALSQLAR